MPGNPLGVVQTAVKKLLAKKNIRIGAIAASVLVATTAIALPVMFGKDEKDSYSAKEAIHNNAFVADETYGASEQKLKQGYALFIDGEFIAVAEDKETAEAAVEKAATITATYFGAGDEAVLSSNVEIAEGSFEKSTLKDEAAILESLGVAEDTVNPDDIKLKVRYSIPQEEEVTVPYETLYFETQFLNKGVEKTMQVGEEGLSKVQYEVVYENGFEVEKKEIDTEVLVAYKPEIIERGIGRSASASASLDMFFIPYLGRISSSFGWRTLFGAPDLHDGLDIVHADYTKSCYGDPVKAAYDGVVVKAGPSGGYGNYVVIQHENGLQTGYAHLSQIGVTVGQEVKTGDILGKIGSTGKSTGPHLHFEVIIDGVKVDPLQFLKDADLLG